MRKLCLVWILLLVLNACVKVASQQDSTKNLAEREIRAALCEVEKSDYAAAQKRVEKLLQSEPENIYAQRLLPGTMAGQIKLKDKSSGNIALVKQTIEAYSRALNNPRFSGEEKRGVDNYLLNLHINISQEEYDKELKKRVSDSSRPAKDRSLLYVILASQSWSCAHEIISKKTPIEKVEIEKAKSCVAKGFDYVNQAITLNADNEVAWTYKVELSKQAYTLAGIEKNSAQEASYQKQADEAQKHLKEILAKQYTERAKKLESMNKEIVIKREGYKEKPAKELTEYKAENSLDEMVKEIYIPMGDLETLVSDSEDGEKERQERIQKKENQEKERRAKLQEKHEWKNFAQPGEDLIADMPDNLSSSVQGDTRSYVASSEGIRYEIFSLPRPTSHKDASLDDSVLNSTGWAFVDTFGRAWLYGSSPAAFEIKLLRKEIVDGQPGRIYSYTFTSCTENKYGSFVVYVGKTRYYTIDIIGANESDVRVQRFLKSVKFK